MTPIPSDIFIQSFLLGALVSAIATHFGIIVGHNLTKRNQPIEKASVSIRDIVDKNKK